MTDKEETAFQWAWVNKYNGKVRVNRDGIKREWFCIGYQAARAESAKEIEAQRLEYVNHCEKVQHLLWDKDEQIQRLQRVVDAARHVRNLLLQAKLIGYLHTSYDKPLDALDKALAATQNTAQKD